MGRGLCCKQPGGCGARRWAWGFGLCRAVPGCASSRVLRWLRKQRILGRKAP